MNFIIRAIFGEGEVRPAQSLPFTSARDEAARRKTFDPYNDDKRADFNEPTEGPSSALVYEQLLRVCRQCAHASKYSEVFLEGVDLEDAVTTISGEIMLALLAPKRPYKKPAGTSGFAWIRSQFHFRLYDWKRERHEPNVGRYEPTPNQDADDVGSGKPEPGSQYEHSVLDFFKGGFLAQDPQKVQQLREVVDGIELSPLDGERHPNLLKRWLEVLSEVDRNGDPLFTTEEAQAKELGVPRQTLRRIKGRIIERNPRVLEALGSREVTDVDKDARERFPASCVLASIVVRHVRKMRRLHESEESNVISIESSAEWSGTIDLQAVADDEGSLVDLIRGRRRAWTAEELSELLAISVKTIYAMAKSGRLPSLRFGSNVRFDPAMTAAWVERHQHAA